MAHVASCYAQSLATTEYFKEVNTMELRPLQQDAIKAAPLELTPGYAHGYHRALLDVRCALCFADDENQPLDVVLSLLDQQNKARTERVST